MSRYDKSIPKKINSRTANTTKTQRKFKRKYAAYIVFEITYTM